MKKNFLITFFALTTIIFGCSKDNNVFLDCATPHFQSLNLEIKTELKKFEHLLIEEKIIENNSAESYRVLFGKVFSMNNEREFGTLDFHYKAEKLTKIGVMDKCQVLVDADFKKSYDTKMESITPELKKIGTTVPGQQSKFLLTSLKELPLKHFTKTDTQFYILFKAYSLGCLTKTYY